VLQTGRPIDVPEQGPTVSSGLAFAPLRVTPSYNATKAAIHMLSESLRLQLAGTSVAVV
jgi:uncharacterized oxidoreductase